MNPIQQQRENVQNTIRLVEAKIQLWEVRKNAHADLTQMRRALFIKGLWPAFEKVVGMNTDETATAKARLDAYLQADLNDSKAQGNFFDLQITELNGEIAVLRQMLTSLAGQIEQDTSGDPLASLPRKLTLPPGFTER